jgi:signal transduction histidine kinase
LEELPYYCRLAMHPRRITLMVLSLAFAFEAGIMLVLPKGLEAHFGPWGVAVADSLLLTLLLVPCLWWVIVVPLRRVAECRQHLLNWALAGEERKAGQLARDLHDGLGQFTAAINIGLKAIEDSSSDQHVIGQARHLREIGRQLHEAIRVLARGLRPTVLDDIGLAAAVTNYATETTAQHHTPVTAAVADLEPRRLPNAIETALYRIVQEAVTNAIRHGKPHRIDIETEVDDHHVELAVVDDGQGFNPDEVFNCRTGGSSPFGLISIRERVHLLGGVAKIESSPGKGTQLTVRIPLDRSSATHE